MIKRVKGLISVILALIVMGSVICVPINAQNTEVTNNTEITKNSNSYMDYLESFDEPVYPNQNISVDVSAAVLGVDAKLSNVEIEGKQAKAVFFSKEGATAAFNFTVAEAGLYNLEFVYKTVVKENNLAAVEIDLSVDGNSYDWLNGV